MTIDMAQLSSQMYAVQSAVSSIGSQLQQAAPTGEFDQVMASVAEQIQSALDPQATTETGDTDVLDTDALGTGALANGLSEPTGADVVAQAAQYIGVPYQWGGTNPATGLDCSGLTQLVYADLGVSLPRTSQEQVNVGTPVASLADAQPGDLLFFEPTYDGPGHVGIYVGNGMMIDAPHTGTDVQEQPVSDAGTPIAIRQILSSSSPAYDTSALSADMGTAAVSGSSSSSAGLNVPSALAPLFVSAGGQYGLPASLLAAVAQTESNYDPSAVSSAGAEGMMQLMPGTAQSLGVQDPFDPTQAVDGAAQMLSGLVKQFGSVPLALAAYNAGPGAVEQYGGIPPYPQTQAYVQKIMGLVGASS